MTAEIGVLNTIGVALAADSAVTIGTGVGPSKIFNTADKLFSLSKHHPVGIMIYGNATFMGAPWETVIKVFRKQLGDTVYDTLQEYCDKFIDFLKNDAQFYDRNYEQSLIMGKFIKFLDGLLQTVNDTVPNIGKANPNQNDIANIIFGEARYWKDEYEKENMIPDFPTYYPLIFENMYSIAIEQILDSRINFSLDKETKDLFIDIGSYLVMREQFENPTGVVIAGFGESEIYPVLKCYEIEGIFEWVLKYKESHDIHINATNQRATVVPFAQQEMVHSFLTGIDPELKGQIIGLIQNIVTLYPGFTDQNIINLNQEQKQSMLDLGSNLLSQFTEHIERFSHFMFAEPVISTVSSLPKEELAAMAEALVNLTSIKRKMSSQSETVGGPIDVVVISKGDGFIWIKRKHYFSPDLNHTYFKNYLER